MALDVYLQDERGNEIESVSDTTNVLHKILPDVGDTSYTLLRFIDIAADTTFNHLQIPTFLSEWDRLMETPWLLPADKQFLRAVRDMAARALPGEMYHTYLKFEGD